MSPASFWTRGEQEVSLARLYVMRAIALLAIWGLFPTVQALFDHAPMDRGVHKALISALWLMAFIAFRYPLKMVPLLLFEMAWKLVWLLSFGLPQWWSGAGSPQLGQDLWDIGAFPIVCALVIPWGYVGRHYVTAPAERWKWVQSSCSTGVDSEVSADNSARPKRSYCSSAEPDSVAVHYRRKSQ